MDIFNKKAKESEQTTGKLDDVFRALSPSAITAVAGITALVASVKSLSQASLTNYAHFEKLEMGLTTFFQSAEKGKAKFEELRKLSNETTFGVDELTDSFTQMANVGVDVDTIKDKLTMLGDLAQGDKSKFAELTSIYAKINSTGKAGALQLQQIASRGIPIYDMLKKIGVQGTATADDITKAFQKMTEEGGQFHDAMNNINQTIEGKQGFISDYLKEMSVNFAEVTGLADAYKDVLDVLKDVIGAISDKLLEWSKDPVMKAIISGLFVGAIASIATALLTSLIPTLATVIAKLTTIRLLEGAKGWAVLAVAGISVAVGAYASYSRSLKQATEDNEKLRKAVEDTKKAMGNNYGLLNVGVNTTSTAVKSRDSAKNTLEQYQKNLEGFQEKLKDAEKAVTDIQAKISADGGGLTGYEGRLEQAKNKVEEWKTAVEITTKSIDNQTKTLKFWEDEVKRLSVDELATQFEEIYNSTLPKEQAEIESLRTQLNTVLEYEKKLKTLNGQQDANGNIIDYNKSKQAIDDTIRYLENKLKGVNAWEDIFKSVTGIAVPKAGSGDKSRGQLAGEAYIARTDKQFEAQIKAKSLLGGDSKTIRQEVASEFVKDIEKQIESLISNIDVDLPFEETDATIQALNQSLVKYKEMIDKTTESTGNFFSKLQQEVDEIVLKAQNGGKLTAGEYGKYAGSQALSSASSVGGDAGTFINTFMQTGNVFLALISTIIGALVNVLQEVDGFEETLSPITRLFKQLKPSLEMIVEEVQYAEDTMNTVLRPLMGILNIIFKVLKPISEVLNAIIRVFFTAFGLFDSLSNWLEELGFLTKEEAKSKEEELARQKALTNAYSNMLSVLRDTQEEYEKRKKYINAQGYADSVTGVHDMILTPQGKFSTDPDDYIIATKNPSGLNGGKGDIIINNYSNAQVEAKQDDMGNTVILISQKVAMDYAQGNNGWDSAVQARQARMAGRSLAM